ncbi:MAG: bifunctional 5,10-methylenetetrahydrofolate dehydrogenase/5,10-methenyltetrahydrofolate cyclohydrolase [Acidobacteriota bacterium]
MAEKPLDEITPFDPDARGRRLDGKLTSSHILAEVGEHVTEFVERVGRQPKLVAVLVGDDPASATYVASKARGCERVGILGETLRLDAEVTHDTVADTVRTLIADDSVDGVLVQLPLPRQVDAKAILDLVDPAKDVDGFHPASVGRLWSGRPALAPATPSGVIELLHRYQVPLQGRHAVIVGRSNIVGKPMAALLLREHCTVTVCHSRTRDLEAVCRSGDLLIAAVGRTAMIGPDHVRDGAVVIDVGINRIEDSELLAELYPGNEKRRRGFAKRGYSVVGDVDYHHAAPKAAAITPVPGGVGRLTVAMVIANTLAAARRRAGLDSE